MSGVNKAIIVGFLGQDPEARNLDSGSVVCNFSVATNESWKDKNGDRQERVEWHQIVAWGALAETCDQYLEKGRQVYIEGTLQTRDWEDRDGNKRQTTEIVAQRVQFLGGGSGENRERDRDDRGGDDRQSSRGRDDRSSGRRAGSRERSGGSRGRDRDNGGRKPWAARGGR